MRVPVVEGCSGPQQAARTRSAKQRAALRVCVVVVVVDDSSGLGFVCVCVVRTWWWAAVAGLPLCPAVQWQPQSMLLLSFPPPLLWLFIACV